MIRTVEIIAIRIAIDRFTLTSCSLDSIIISLFSQILNVLIKEIIFVELNPRKRVIHDSNENCNRSVLEESNPRPRVIQVAEAKLEVALQESNQRPRVIHLYCLMTRHTDFVSVFQLV